MKFSHYSLVVLLLLPLAAAAAQQPSYAAPPSAVSAGSVLQAFFGLALVLAMVAGAAWLLKRLIGRQIGASGAIKIIGGAAVGQRERIVLVEIKDTWLLVGVAPGQVRTLHTMPRSELELPLSETPEAKKKFSEWLRQVMEKRHEQ